jgi:hypothetical protein
LLSHTEYFTPAPVLMLFHLFLPASDPESPVRRFFGFTTKHCLELPVRHTHTSPGLGLQPQRLKISFAGTQTIKRRPVDAPAQR